MQVVRGRGHSSGIEQRTNIKFCFKLGKTAAETVEMMRKVYGGNCLSRAQIFRWYALFKSGEEMTEDEAMPGRPFSVYDILPVHLLCYWQESSETCDCFNIDIPHVYDNEELQINVQADQRRYPTTMLHTESNYHYDSWSPLGQQSTQITTSFQRQNLRKHRVSVHSSLDISTIDSTVTKLDPLSSNTLPQHS